MAKQITRWKPDTCKCVIEYSWDSSVPDDRKTHSLHRIVSKCPAHEGMSDKDIFSAVTEENPRKNIALTKLMEKFPHLTEEITDESGNKSKSFKAQYQPTFKFDSDRKLAINIPNLSSRDKSLAKAEINKHFKDSVDLA